MLKKKGRIKKITTFLGTIRKWKAMTSESVSQKLGLEGSLPWLWNQKVIVFRMKDVARSPIIRHTPSRWTVEFRPSEFRLFFSGFAHWFMRLTLFFHHYVLFYEVKNRWTPPSGTRASKMWAKVNFFFFISQLPWALHYPGEKLTNILRLQRKWPTIKLVKSVASKKDKWVLL